jgi:hypothetical protein
LTVDLPAGMAVNPNATPVRCTEAELVSNSHGGGCPAASAVGTAEIDTASIGALPGAGFSDVYNMVPPPGVSAELAFEIANLGLFEHVTGGVLTGDGYRLSGTIDPIIQKGVVLDGSLTLWGDPSDSSHDAVRGACADPGFGETCPVTPSSVPFLTMPFACSGPLTATASMDSYQSPETFVSDSALSTGLNGEPAEVTGCEQLDFTPQISVTPDTSAAESPAGLNVNLSVPQAQSQAGLAEANLADATVALPAGMTVNPSAATGLAGCTLEGPEGINLKSAEPAHCPGASKIGTVQLETPLLPSKLEGGVFVAAQGNLAGNGSNPFGSLLAIYLVAEGEGAYIKLPGRIELNGATGQVIAHFGPDPATGEEALPDLPFSDLRMSFYGGPRATLITPSSCGSYATSSTLTPWSGTAAVGLSSPFAIGSGCTSGFVPSFTAGTSPNQAGGSTALSVTFSRHDGEQRFSGTQIKTPPGLLGVLKSVVRCSEPQASEGNCGPESLIGEATTTVGAGEIPYVVRGGKVYLTGPYKGAPFGLSIVVPTSAGPFTLKSNGGFGREIVRAAINVDPHTAQITVTSDPLPTMIEGVPLDVRTVNVTVNRLGFMVNPTNCSPLSVSGTITSTAGATSSVSTPFTAANCATLPFHPSFSASTAGKTSKADGASLSVKIAFPNPGPSSSTQSGEANIAKVHVELPKSLPARLTTLQKACTEKQFAENPAGCPAESIVGHAKAITPILPVPWKARHTSSRTVVRHSQN